MISENIDSTIWQKHAWRNRIQTLALLGVMEGFLSLLGWLLWGPVGIVVLIMVGLMGMMFTPAISPWMLIRMYNAVPIALERAPVLDKLLSQLSRQAELSQPPKLFYVPSRMLNAFAIGSRQQSIIVVTDGLLRQLSWRELSGVLAHEISHISHNDLRVMGLADLFSRTTSLLSLVGQCLLLLNLPLIILGEQSINWWAIMLLIFAPTVSALAQLALSRTREFDADLNAARLVGDPEGLASALVKIEHVHGGWLERLITPGRRLPNPSLLRTHPETEERINRLMALKPHLSENENVVADEASFDAAHVVGKPVRRHPGWHITGLWH